MTDQPDQRQRQKSLAILALCLVVTGLFYFLPKVFVLGSETPAQWIAASWNTENDQVHCWGIFPIFGWLLWRKRTEFLKAQFAPVNAGLWIVGAGVAAYVLSVRAQQPRLAIFALPLLVFGSALYLWGWAVARLVAFPAIFLLFMTPIGGIIQGTAGLQVKTAAAIRVMSSLFGIPIQVDGAIIRSPTGQFEPMEVAGGCSGIRSLMAMLMLAALYAEFNMRTPVRKVILFSLAIVFAIIGNFARVFSVVLFAKFLDPKTATGLYHDWSGFVFFPVAVMAMVGAGNVLDRDWSFLRSAVEKMKAATDKTDPPEGGAPPGEKEPEQKKKGPISYDY